MRLKKKETWYERLVPQIDVKRLSAKICKPILFDENNKTVFCMHNKGSDLVEY